MPPRKRLRRAVSGASTTTMGSNISEDDGLHMHIAGSENLLEEAGGGGTHFVPGTKTLVGAASATVNRQSVAMKLQLRVIEQNVARLMESREQLTAINKLIRSAQVPLAAEQKELRKIMEYSKTSITNEMTIAEFQEFYYKHFILGNTSGSEPPPPEQDPKLSAEGQVKLEEELELD